MCTCIYGIADSKEFRLFRFGSLFLAATLSVSVHVSVFVHRCVRKCIDVCMHVCVFVYMVLQTAKRCVFFPIVLGF